MYDFRVKILVMIFKRFWGLNDQRVRILMRQEAPGKSGVNSVTAWGVNCVVEKTSLFTALNVSFFIFSRFGNLPKIKDSQTY